jgi:two-component system, cell cycle response regulator
MSPTLEGQRGIIRTAEPDITSRLDGRRPLRVLLAHDRARDVSHVREAMRETGAPPLEVSEAVRLSRLVASVMRANPDVVLIGLGEHAGDGLDALRRLHTVAPQFPVVALAHSADELLAAEAVREGAQDYVIEETITPQTLARAMWCAVERHRRLNALREQSWTDPLTGLYNRRGFATLAESHLLLARRNRRRVLLLCADLDDLKDINDRFGHEEGDRALTRTAHLLRRSLRESDIIARFGGDEFVALAHDADQRSVAAVLARIQSRFDADQKAEPRPYVLSISVGAAGMDPAGASLETLLTRADESLYRDKRRRPAAGRAPGAPPGPAAARADGGTVPRPHGSAAPRMPAR